MSCRGSEWNGAGVDDFDEVTVERVLANQHAEDPTRTPIYAEDREELRRRGLSDRQIRRLTFPAVQYSHNPEARRALSDLIYLSSWSALAEMLGTNQAALCRYRKGVYRMPDHIAEQVLELRAGLGDLDLGNTLPIESPEAAARLRELLSEGNKHAQELLSTTTDRIHINELLAAVKTGWVRTDLAERILSL